MRGENRYTATAEGGEDALKCHTNTFTFWKKNSSNQQHTHWTWSELQQAKGFNNHHGKVRIKKYMTSAKEYLGNTNNKPN